MYYYTRLGTIKIYYLTVWFSEQRSRIFLGELLDFPWQMWLKERKKLLGIYSFNR